MANHSIDSPNRAQYLRELIKEKSSLRLYYDSVYTDFLKELEGCKAQGQLLELGSGGGFLKEKIPSLITSDAIAYPNVDQVIDGRELPFSDGSLKAIFLMNVFHHIPDAKVFLAEVSRTLAPQGLLYMFEPYPGWVGAPLLKYLHHEGYDSKTKAWSFQSSGPLSDANNALAWIVFERDREQFEKLFPELTISVFERQWPLYYWLSGGMKKWTLLPPVLAPMALKADAGLAKLVPQMASFVKIVLTKQER